VLTCSINDGSFSLDMELPWSDRHPHTTRILLPRFAGVACRGRCASYNLDARRSTVARLGAREAREG
jgi:hypothetical protein